MTPGQVSPKKVIPDHITKPSYALTGIPTDNILEVPEIKHYAQIERMRKSCALATQILKRIELLLEVNYSCDY